MILIRFSKYKNINVLILMEKKVTGFSIKNTDKALHYIVTSTSPIILCHLEIN
jgi:hypothetical protein